MKPKNAITTKAIREKVEKFAQLLGVSDYFYYVNLVPRKEMLSKDGDSFANIVVDNDTREACLQINRDLLKEKPEELDKTIIHELLHARFDELIVLFHRLIKLYVKDRRAKQFYKLQLDSLEHKIIVALTEAIAKQT